MGKRLTFTVLLLLLVLLTGCSNKNKKNDLDQTAEVKVYYIDTTSSTIVSEKFTPSVTGKDGMVGELLYALKQEPKNVIYKSALPEMVKVNEFYFSEDDRLTINFDTSYYDLKGIPEILCRAAIVKTLSQIDGVEYIEFYVNGQPLKNTGGEVVISMTDEDFIESIGDETNYKASLYFTNENGDELIEYITDIYYTGTSTIEELVINQLINGPTKAGLYPTIPEGTTLLDVNTKEGICYIDFNEKFLENVSGIKNEVVIYSVVNSLVELPNINKVQFLINGEVQKTYRENLAFDKLFDRNLDLIKGSK